MTSSSSEICTLKYFGRDMVVSNNNPVVIRSVKELNDIIAELSKGSYNSDPKWTGLREELMSLSNSLLHSENLIKRYRIELLQDAVIPYIKKMKSRISLDSDRFYQIQSLLALCVNSESNSSHHVAEILLEVDKIIRSIKSKGGWFKSDLAISLEMAAGKQWRPVINDNRHAMHRLGSRLLLVGVVEVVGRSFLMMWPVYLILLDVLQALKGVEEKKGFLPIILIKLVKSFLILLVVMKLITILSMLNGVGYMCLLTGAGLLTASLSDELIKHTAHILSPNLAIIESMFDRVHSLEDSLSDMLLANQLTNKSNNSGFSRSAASSERRVDPHPQVQEIHENPADKHNQGDNNRQEPSSFNKENETNIIGDLSGSTGYGSGVGIRHRKDKIK